MICKTGRTLAIFLSLVLCVLVAAEDAKPEEKQNVGLRNEEDVEKIREEAISKLEKPLEKMKVKVGKPIPVENRNQIALMKWKPKRRETVLEEMRR
jgi:hypothetical protein